MNNKQLKVLIVEDSEDDALLLERHLQKGGFKLDTLRVTNSQSIKDALKDRVWDIVISDHNIPGLSSEIVLELVQQSGIDIPFIIVSGSIGEEIAVQAMKTGAHDYIMKDNLARLVPAIERELREARRRRAHKEAQKVIHHLAYHDSLTGLTNRHEFENHINVLLSDIKVVNQKNVLLYIDLDQFKIINDTCGHVAGDELLKQLAKLISEPIRSGDTLARLGGDEFGVLLVNCGIQDAERIARKILEVIKDYKFVWDAKTFAVGASIGLVEFNGLLYNDMSTVLSAADMSCYAAKDLGRNRIHIYDQNEVDMLKRKGEMQWVSRITQALEEDRFTLFKQTILPLQDSNEDHNVEFLIRMIDEDGELIYPGAFIPAAERYSLAVQIDKWVIKNAFHTFVKMRKLSNPPGMVFINLSGASLSDNDLFHFIRESVTETGIEQNRVCFEITETAAIAHLGSAVSFIEEIRDEGFKFALDDFGAGLSSFSYLKTIPVDFIKVDGSFIRDMISDPMDEAIVESINKIGRLAGLKTIAEFVENGAIFNRLVEMGFDYAQGYYIHMPEQAILLESGDNAAQARTS